jgi:hypothetical protein
MADDPLDAIKARWSHIQGYLQGHLFPWMREDDDPVTEAAGNLPSFVPGFETGVDKIHFKHGLASLILALALFVFAWFQSAPQRQ